MEARNPFLINYQKGVSSLQFLDYGQLTKISPRPILPILKDLKISSWWQLLNFFYLIVPIVFIGHLFFGLDDWIKKR